MPYTATSVLPLTITAPRQLLGAGDFAYLGYYDIADGLTEAGLGSGLTHRYVSGQLRFLILRFNSGYRPREYTPPASFGANCTAGTNWDSQAIWGGAGIGNGCQASIKIDPATGRLWGSASIDYPSDPQINYTSALCSCVLNSNATVSDWKGWYGVQGVSQRAHYGGVVRVPSWFQTASSTGPWLSGFGGYTSRMAQGMVPSMGPMALFLPDLDSFPVQPWASQGIYNVPASAAKIAADHRGGTTGPDWYATGFATRPRDRGIQAATVSNEMDGGQWLSPATGDPQGWGRWAWGSSYWSTHTWVDDDAGTRQRHGLLAVASVATGRAWYETSYPRWEGRAFELHVFDPAHLSQVMAGTRQKWDVRPVSVIPLTLAGMTGGGKTGTTNVGSVGGATFDPLTNRLYVCGYGLPNGTNGAKARIYVYSVGA